MSTSAASGYAITLTMSAALASCIFNDMGILESADGSGSGSVVVLPSPTATPTPTPSPSPTPTPVPANIQRLKAAVAAGAELTVDPQIVTVTTLKNQTGIPDGAVVDKRDPRFRLLGGRHNNPSGYPGPLYLWPQSTTYLTPTSIEQNGFTHQRKGLNNGLHFTIPAGMNQFELMLYDGGAPNKLQIRINDKLTDSVGYDLPSAGSGAMLNSLITLPASEAPRDIKLDYGWRPFGGVRVKSGQSIGTLPVGVSNYASVVYMGDSISEGAVSTHPNKTWVMQSSFRLGIQNPINVGVGSTGYISRRGTNLNNFNDRADDVLKAVNGGPPDALVVAGGINDCASDGSNAQAVGTAALQFFQTMRAGAPDMPIFVLGPFASYNLPYPDYLVTCRNFIFDAAGQVSRTYTIDTSTWVTLENRDQMFNGIVNGPHPLDAGHYIYGQRAAEAIKSYILVM